MNPPFASNVVLELWEEDNLSHSITVTISLLRFFTTVLLGKSRFATTR